MFDKLQKSAQSILHSGVPDASVYRRYRVEGRNLNHKIIDAMLDQKAIHEAGKSLGILGRDDILVFDNEGEMSVLMDYALYEWKVKGKNAVERYQEEIGGETEIERELLTAMVGASTSLFEIESISRATYSLELVDLIDENHTITLMDMNFSQQVMPDYLLFIRPITFENFSMTSGFSFLFPGRLEEEMIERWRKSQLSKSRRLQRRRNKLPLSARRYVKFFKLSLQKGLEVRYADQMANSAGDRIRGM